VAIFIWNDSYNTGVETVDSQHHVLVKVINQLDDALAQGRDMAAVAQLLGELAAYVQYHFTTEETMMLAAGAAAKHFRLHKAEHEAFAAKVRNHAANLGTGDRAATGRLQDFLVSWLARHILLVDKEMARLLQGPAALDASGEQDLARRIHREAELAQRALIAALQQAREQLETRVAERTRELGEANRQLLQERAEQQNLIKKLEQAHVQLLQSEKMASIGQLAAGVAHEINNPIGYVNSNLGSLDKYVRDLLRMLQAYESETGTNASAAIQALRREIDIEFLREDAGNLLKESLEGVDRVKRIVQDLKDFSHVDEAEWQWANLNRGLDSTLNVAANEIKYKAEVVKDYGEIPDVRCLPQQINQVFMNVLVNAAQAMETRGTIRISTRLDGEHVCVTISDTGNGIPPEILNRIFDPFFTTKPIGKGTGLGLSIAYGIINKHQGKIEVESVVGKGTTFRIQLPVKSGLKSGSE
jgi:hemerythrin-like metal-binding protein